MTPEKAIDPFRRNLQKQYVDIMISLMNPSTNFASGVATWIDHFIRGQMSKTPTFHQLCVAT
jgi:hypothetical protein